MNRKRIIILGLGGALLIASCALFIILGFRSEPSDKSQAVNRSQSAPLRQLTNTLKPTDDAFVVSNESEAAKNVDRLDIHNASATCSTKDDCPGFSAKSFLRFEVPELNEQRVTAVTLRLYVVNTSGDAGKVRLIRNANWKETNINWRTANALQGTYLTSIGSVVESGWLDISLPPRYFTSGAMTLMIENQDKNRVSFSSKESANQPELIVLSETGGEFIDDAKNTKDILAGGDIVCDDQHEHVGGPDCNHGPTADLIGQHKPEAVLLLGDIQYEIGKYDVFMRMFHPTWGQYRELLKPSPGNHEYGNSAYSVDNRDGCPTFKLESPFAYACGYFDYFNGVSAATGMAGERGRGYYAFDVGTWRVYSLNSNCTFGDGCGEGSAQERWLREDLAQYPNQCKLMFLHHPISSSDTRNFDAYLEGLPDLAQYLDIRRTIDPLKALYQAFYDYGGDVVLAGHSHFYERFGYQNVGRQKDESGFRQFVVGTAGRYTYDIDLKHRRPNSEVFSKADDLGLLKMQLSDTGYKWEFLPVNGTKLTDTGSNTCHFAK